MSRSSRYQEVTGTVGVLRGLKHHFKTRHEDVNYTTTTNLIKTSLVVFVFSDCVLWTLEKTHLPVPVTTPGSRPGPSTTMTHR